MTKIETYLPIFSGFYHTVFEPQEEQEVDYINEVRENLGLDPISYDDCEWDYKAYQKEVSEQSTCYIERKLIEILDSKIKLTFQELVSPKQYNFSNDSINIEISLTKKTLSRIKSYLVEHKEAFSVYLEKYRSCDGFCSAYSDDVEIWIGQYFSEIENYYHYLGSMLEFILLDQGIDDMDIYDNLSDCYLSATNYTALTTK